MQVTLSIEVAEGVVMEYELLLQPRNDMRQRNTLSGLVHPRALLRSLRPPCACPFLLLSLSAPRRSVLPPLRSSPLPLPSSTLPLRSLPSPCCSPLGV